MATRRSPPRQALYSGVDAEGSFNLGLRYFGIGAKASAGVGLGAEGEARASFEDGRLSLGAEGKVGLLGSLGLGGDVWVDFGQMGRDLGWLVGPVVFASRVDIRVE